MIKNHDFDQIVIDRKMFEKLMELAAAGASEYGEEQTLAKVKRHVRKFNTAYAESERIKREALASQYRKAKSRTKWLNTARIGNHVWFPVGNTLVKGILSSAKRNGINLDHARMKVAIMTPTIRKGYLRNCVTSTSVLLELPAGWRQTQSDWYAECYIQAEI